MTPCFATNALPDQETGSWLTFEATRWCSPSEVPTLLRSATNAPPGHETGSWRAPRATYLPELSRVTYQRLAHMEWCSTYFGSNEMSKSGLNRTGVAVFSRKYSCMRFTVQYSSGPQTPCFIGRCYKDCRLFTSELELGLIQTHKTQKLVLRVEVGAC